MEIDDRPIIVSIWCLTYNHEKYIRQCLDGFVMQKTSFRFEAIVHDDASTDGTADIVREYAEKYPDIIKPIIETENQYSKKDGSLERIMEKSCTGKYVALCEGDDYWTDPMKLQKQVGWLEEHPEYVMCSSDAAIQTERGDVDWSRYVQDTYIPVRDMILGGGLFIQTVTLLYRTTLRNEATYPDCCKKCHVGDYPLQIWASLHGKVRYFAEKQATYRYGAEGSWGKKQQTLNIMKLIAGWRSEMDMLQGLDSYSCGQYHDVFLKRQIEFVRSSLVNHSDHLGEISNAFADITKSFPKIERFQLFCATHNMRWIANFLYQYENNGIKPAIVVLPGISFLYQIKKSIGNS